MKLQPIESAPKDGKLIILHVGGAHTPCYKTAFWSGMKWLEPFNCHDWTHWCPLPTLEDDAELQAVKAERDSLRFALIETAECLACWVGDSPNHQASQTVLLRAKKALNRTPKESAVDGRAE